MNNLIYKHRKIIMKKIALLLFLSCLYAPQQLFALTIPEGIRGFTVTYGTWIEAVLAQNPLKDIFYKVDLSYYEKYQKLVIVSERLCDEGNYLESISYAKRAEYLLNDIYDDLKIKFEWKGSFNNNSEQVAKWSEQSRENWYAYLYQKIYLLLQNDYIFLFHNPREYDERYLREAQNLLQYIDKDSNIYKKISKSYVIRYIDNSLQLIRKNKTSHNINFAQLVETLHQYQYETTVKPDEYWSIKYLKKNMVLLASYGYPEQAKQIFTILTKSSENSITINLSLLIYIMNGQFDEVQSLLTAQLGTLNLLNQETWGSYITNKNLLFRYYLYIGQTEEALSELDDYIKNLSMFITKSYLTTDIYTYLQSQLSYAKVHKLVLTQYIYNKIPTDLQLNELEVNDYLDEDLKTYITVFKLQYQKTIPAQHVEESLGYILNTFMENIKQGDFKNANRLIVKAEKQNYRFITNYMKLQFAMESPEQLKGFNNPRDSWFKLWSNLIVQNLFISDTLFSIENGVAIHFNLENDLIAFIDKNNELLNPEEIKTLFDLLMIKNNRTMENPELYFSAAEHRLRFYYIIQWHLASASTIYDDLNTPDQLSTNKFTCPANSACWLIYPADNFAYSIIWDPDNDNLKLFRKINNYQDSILNQSTKFLQSMTSNKSYQSQESLINDLSNEFNQELALLENAHSLHSLKQMTYLPYKNAHTIPMETLSIKGKIISKEMRITRKLNHDIFFQNLSCQIGQCIEAAPKINASNEISEKKHFLIGFGSKSGNLIFNRSSSDEISDIETLFEYKEIILNTSDLSRTLFNTIDKAGNIIIHIAGEIIPTPKNIFINLGNDEEQLDLNDLFYIKKIPILVFSKQHIDLFNDTKNISWEKAMQTFDQKQTQLLLTSLTLSPVEFRQSFFYDFYYKLENKNMMAKDAFYSSIERTEKGFTKTYWPYIMVLYEK